MKRFLAVCIIFLNFAGTTSATSFDMQGVVFKPGHPLMGESLDLAVMSPRDLQGLTVTIASLKANPTFRIEIVGHADGDECLAKACDRLAQRRAVYVFRYLLVAGVNPKQIIAIRASGFTLPLARERSERWRNRRAEIVLRDDLFTSPDL